MDEEPPEEVARQLNEVERWMKELLAHVESLGEQITTIGNAASEAMVKLTNRLEAVEAHASIADDWNSALFKLVLYSEYREFRGMADREMVAATSEERDRKAAEVTVGWISDVAPPLVRELILSSRDTLVESLCSSSAQPPPRILN